MVGTPTPTVALEGMMNAPDAVDFDFVAARCGAVEDLIRVLAGLHSAQAPLSLQPMM
jgi:hypothetical protein